MTGMETFAFGVAGTSATLLMTQVLPVLADWQSGKAKPRFAPWPLVGFVGTFVILASLGGAFALVVGGTATEMRDAFVYGLGWQGSWSSLVKGNEAVRAIQTGLPGGPG